MSALTAAQPRAARWFALGFALIGATASCYQSHLVAPADGGLERDTAPDARASCEFTFRTTTAVASCSVDADAEETCVEVARCICAADLFPEWSGLSCVESALVLRALVTLGDYCSTPRETEVSLSEALHGFAGFWGAEIETSSGCDDIEAYAVYPRSER